MSTVEYVFMESAEGDPVECDSCSYEAPLHKFNVPARRPRSTAIGEEPRLRTEPRLYCKLCAGSFASNASQYLKQYPDRNVMATICHVGNAILQQLGTWAAVLTETLPDESDESDFR